MRPAGIRLAAVLMVAFTLASCSHASDPGGRAAPSRPTAARAIEAPTPKGPSPLPRLPLGSNRTLADLASRRIGGVEYVRLADVASQLGLRFRPHDANHAASLYAPGVRADIDADTRDVIVNGLRVFLGSPAMRVRGELYVSRIDYEDCLAPMLRPGLGVSAPPPPRIVVIDPGHGGSDPGGINPRLKLFEKTFTFDVAVRLKALLEHAGYKVVLTRNNDHLPAPKADDQDLKIRALIANREHADLFVSIHFNVVERDSQRTRGIEVYTFPPANQHATDWWSSLAKNDPHLETAPVPANRFDHWNVVLAEQLHREMLQNLHTDDRGKKLMHLGVLRSLNCPGVLVEPGVITNDAEARKLATPEYRQAIAESLCRGIQDYSAVLERLRSSRPSEPATTQRRRTSRSS